MLYCALTYALGHGFWVALGIAVLATAVGIPAATIVAREFGREDPGLVVIDEVAGQALPLALAGLDWKYVLGAFLLFRAFDIVKPFPVRSLERLPEGTGIVVDDLGAGLYAALVLWGVQYFARYGTH